MPATRTLPHGLSVVPDLNDQSPTAQAVETFNSGHQSPQPSLHKNAIHSMAKRSKKPVVQLDVSPFPNHIRPTRKEVFLVNYILSTAHGSIEEPDVPPMPSLTVAGCGNVPFVLEALIRTIISAHVSMTAANQAIKGLLSRYNIYQTGPYAGSVNWNEVRMDDPKELAETIRPAGSQNEKARHIQETLQLVLAENNLRREYLRKERHVDDREISYTSDVAVSPNSEIDRVAKLVDMSNRTLLEHPDILTLDFMHAYDDQTAFAELQKFPGVGPKVAACVMLFCMKRARFPVDTHCYRLCQWLNWVPNQKINTAKTFAHVDVRIPDELKYSLHQLMIIHGQECRRCNGKDLVLDDDNDLECPLEHLLDRGRQESHTKKTNKIVKTKVVKSTKAKRRPRKVQGAANQHMLAIEGEENRPFVPLSDTQMPEFDVGLVHDDFEEDEPVLDNMDTIMDTF